MNEDSPANLILIKSRGWRINVDATPPDIPAKRCSYLMLDKKTATLELALVPKLLFVLAMLACCIYNE